MKKGFTLTELLAVIVILSILVIIAIPTYNNIAQGVRKSNLKSTQTIVANTMLSYANKYLIDEIKPAGNRCDDGSCYKCYSIKYIIDNNIFLTSKEKRITDPTTGRELTGYIKVSYDTDKLELNAKYYSECS